MTESSDDDAIQIVARNSSKRRRLFSDDSETGNVDDESLIDLTQNESPVQKNVKSNIKDSGDVDELTVVELKNVKKPYRLLNEEEFVPNKNNKRKLQYNDDDDEDEGDDIDPKAFARSAVKSRNQAKKRKRNNFDDNYDDDVDDDDVDDRMSDLEEDLFEDTSREPTSKVSKKINDLRQQVVDFLQNASGIDLEAIQGVSKKKVEQILMMRPIKNWVDLNRKIENHKSSSINEDIVVNTLATMKSREVVGRLMENCEKLSKDIGKLVDNLSEAKQPSIMNSELQLSSYQLVGLNWLILMHTKGINAILADEMGLGKTIQVIAFLAYLRETLGIRRHFCIIVPSSTIDNWQREFDTWTPDVRVLQYIGSIQERAHIRNWLTQNPDELDVILTTYNIAQNSEDRRLFKKIKFEYLVYDEAHMLKNMKSNRYQNLIKIKSKHRVLLTGTPVQNNLVELMSLLIFTMPKIFASKMHHIESLFGTSISKISDGKTEYERGKIHQAKTIMAPFILRRLKADVLKELPKKTEQIELCKMTEKQALIYKNLIESFKREIEKGKDVIIGDDESSVKRGAAMLMAMRKLANHKLLIQDIFTESKRRDMARILCQQDEGHREANQQLVYEDLSVMHDFELHILSKNYKVLNRFKLPGEEICDSGKFRFLDSLLPTFIESKKKCLIFSQFVMMLDILEEYLDIRKIQYLRLDGSTKTSDRIQLIDEFNHNEDITVFLLSTKAGGLGINLTSASTVIIHDIDYNPMNDLQAQDRSYRIGQTNDVLVYKLITEKSIEEGILNAASDKLKLGNDINGTTGKNVLAKDIRSLLRVNLNL